MAALFAAATAACSAQERENVEAAWTAGGATLVASSCSPKIEPNGAWLAADGGRSIHTIDAPLPAREDLDTYLPKTITLDLSSLD